VSNYGGVGKKIYLMSTLGYKQMNREVEKNTYERGIFLKFLEMENLNIDHESIKNGNANEDEPDILCKFISGEWVGFELGRLTDPIIRKAVNRWEPINGEYIRTNDPSHKIAKKKLRKKYDVTFPVELLLYKEHPIITPDNVILPAIKPVCRIKHNYSRVWFMGDSIELLYERN
jgi:hypothetical protein